MIEKTKGNHTEKLEEFLKIKFKASAMNICQTQPLSMMNVPKMIVEFKEDSKKVKLSLALSNQIKECYIFQKKLEVESTITNYEIKREYL